MREKNKIHIKKLDGLEARQVLRAKKRALINARFREDHRLNKAAKALARWEAPNPLIP